MAIENDVVLIYFEDQPMSFARIESITADHKPNWYHVKLLLLTIPLQVVTWILRDVYINGEDFTMNDKKMRLEKVVCPENSPQTQVPAGIDATSSSLKKASKESKVISIEELKKNK